VLLARTLRSSTFRLALLYITIFGAATLLLFWYVYSATTSYVRDRLDHELTRELGALQSAYHKGGRDGVSRAIADRLAGRDKADTFYLLTDHPPARGAGNLQSLPPDAKCHEEWADLEPDSRGPPLRAKCTTLSDGSRLLVGMTTANLGDFTHQIEAALGLSILLIGILAAVASISVTRRTVGRIEAINATTHEIMQSGLSRRIPLRGTRDEWDGLAANLNSMLDRIEGLMGEVRQVTDNIAHDLRTPLSRMRGRLERAHGKPRDAGSDQALLGELISDLDGVLRMFTSLMRISQIEAHDRSATLRPVDVVALAGEVIELFDAAAEEKGSSLCRIGEPGIFVRGDRDLLFDAMANLIDNALKHGRAAGRVIVAVKQTTGDVVLSVADEGAGIPAAERPKVFRRFYRLERSRGTPGNGLGLSLVAAVARLHHAHIELVDNSPGLKVELHFPAARQEAA